MKGILLLFLILATQSSIAQIAIGSETAHPSSILDLTSITKGLLIPRMTTVDRNGIVNPALGLLIYNTDDSDFNSYNGAVLGWQDFSTAYNSANAIGDISTSSNVDAIATGMTLTPNEGSYLVKFNSQYKNAPVFTSTPTNTESILADLALVISDLDQYFVLGTPEYNSISHTHYASYNSNGLGIGSSISNDLLADYYVGLNIHLYPGAYHETAAINFVTDAVVTLDGLGDPNAKFIFNADAAINTGIGVKFKLINGAQACNIFWLANGAMSIGATNNMIGNCISRAGGMAIGIGSNLDGRLLTTAGALTMGDGSLKIPIGISFINFKSLSTFLAFTASGAVGVTGAPAGEKTYITGDIFTISGFVNFGFTPPYGTGTATTQPIVGPPVVLVGNLYNVYGPNVTSTIAVENNVNSTGTFSFYKNGIEISEATKVVKTNNVSSIITLQTVCIFNGNDVIDIRWKTEAGNTLLMGNRNLILIKVQ